ncbi:MAG: hypothetical protein HQK53_10950 [Oligoflexia bacterium]|nr:hypothetical protein [Oligoflexia bacterium]
MNIDHQKYPEAKIGYLKSPWTLVVRTTSPEDDRTLEIDLSEMGQEKINLLLYPQDLDTNAADLSQLLIDSERFFPVISTQQLGIDHQQFMQMNPQQLHDIFSDYHSKWVLKNNLQLIEEIFSVTTELRGKLENDRSQFFEEVWTLLKSNIGTSSLKIIYHDLAHTETDAQATDMTDILASTDAPTTAAAGTAAAVATAGTVSKKKRKKITNMSVSGDRHPLTEQGGELEEKLISIYASRVAPATVSHPTTPLIISEFDPQKGECLILTSIKSSPIIIMAHLWSLSKLAPSLLKALFSGINVHPSRGPSW